MFTLQLGGQSHAVWCYCYGTIMNAAGKSCNSIQSSGILNQRSCGSFNSPLLKKQRDPLRTWSLIRERNSRSYNKNNTPTLIAIEAVGQRDYSEERCTGLLDEVQQGWKCQRPDNLAYDKTYAGNYSLALCRTTLSVTHPLFSCSLVHSDGFRNTRYNFTNAFIYIDSFDNCLVAKEKKSKSNDTLVVVVRLQGADIFF